MYWDLSFMKHWVFLSSLEVLLRTIDPYLWISDSKWRIFLTYLGTSSKWRDFLPFQKTLNQRPPFSPIFFLGFIPIFIQDKFRLQIRDDPSSNVGKPSNINYLLGHQRASWWNTKHGTASNSYTGPHLQGHETLATNWLI